MMRIAVVAAWVTLATAGWLQGHSEALASEEPSGAVQFRDDLAIYLGCGEVLGPGTVVQVDRTGKVLGTIELPSTPSGLALNKDGLVAALPGHPSHPRQRLGKVVRIDGNGNVETIFQDERTIPHPSAVASDPGSGDILVGFGTTDVLLLLPTGQPKGPRKILQSEGHEDRLQPGSLALAKDGHLLLEGMSGGLPRIYRFRAEKDATLGQPLLPFSGLVAADPSSARWVAALPSQQVGSTVLYPGELRVFEGARETKKIPLPKDKSHWHNSLGFGPDGTLVIAFCDSKRNGEDIGYEVVVADLRANVFRPLFAWNKSRVVSLAVGPKMTWKK